MNLLFWVCLALVAYAYFGYAIWLWLLSRLRSQPVHSAPITPAVSIILAAHNEEKNLAAKLANLGLLNYPREQLQIVVVSDGSTDGTDGILAQHDALIVAVILPDSKGKANALNQGVRRANGEILAFLDARQSVDPDAIAELVRCFADPNVGAVSGELVLEDERGGPARDALGIYWKIEKLVRKLESSSGSVVGVTGAIYAIRRDLYQEVPAGTLLDDVFIPMNVARAGKRVIFQPAAIARDRIFSDKGKEFSRKVRTLTGNYQLLRLAPWLISPYNPLLFRFISHKLMRLAVPLLLVLMLVASGASKGGLFQIIFCLQVIFYALAVFGAFSTSARNFKLVAIANTFVMLNAAAAVAFYNSVIVRREVWVK